MFIYFHTFRLGYQLTLFFILGHNQMECDVTNWLIVTLRPQCHLGNLELIFYPQQ